MNVSVEDMGSCRKALTVDVAAEKVAPDYEKVLGTYSKYAAIPGFRQGKAPAKIVEKRFAKKIAEDARRELIPKYYEKAISENDIKPVELVNITDVNFDKDTGLHFKIIVDIAPEFKLPKYTKIPVKEQKHEVTDQDVDNYIDELRTSMGSFEEVTDRGLQQGDIATITFTATGNDGASLAELGENCKDIASGEKHMIMLDDVHELVPGLNAGLIGAKPGDKRSINVTFPEDYRIAEVAGSSAVYDVEVNGIRAQKKAELNEDFFKRLEVENEEALREKVRKALEQDAKNKEQSYLQNAIADYLLEKTEMELPQSVVNRETNAQARDIIQQIARQGGSNEYLQSQREDILNTASKNAVNRVKLGYIIHAIADKENITVSAEEVAERLDKLAEYYKVTAMQLREDIEKREGGMAGIEDEVRIGKVFDFLIENAKIK